jgi:4-amino-4-deoxy-L-arabinose transferase-like glycosyltransferase
MSRAPVQPERPSKRSAGTRAFLRKERQERERAEPVRGWRQRSAAVRAYLKRAPRAAWICALIAVLNATAWSVITPPFQGRDEVDHFAYVAHLAETRELPHRTPGTPYTYPSEEALVMEGLHYFQVRFSPFEPSISSDAQQAILNQDASAGQALNDDPQANGASSAPPFFYALQIIPYELGGSNILVKLQLMRLLDALLGGLTALLVFLFLRVTVPRVPWAASVAAICAALQPTFAFTTGSLNPDALLYPLSAAVFLLIAYGFRDVLTMRRAVLLGIVIGFGFVTYLSFVGFAAGAIAGLIVLAIRDARRQGGGRKALTAPATAIAIGLIPPVLYAFENLIRGRPLFGAVSTVGKQVEAGAGSLFDKISYIWELFLPRLPGMTPYFHGLSTWREIWFDRSVGLYGWMDTMFPGWVENIALVLAVIVAALCGRELYVRRGAVRERLPELSSYALISLGVLVMLGIASYNGDAVEHEIAIGEPRYLIVLLPLLGAALALAIRGAGRRWIPVAGAAMVVLFLGHDVFSQLQVIARYYG